MSGTAEGSGVDALMSVVRPVRGRLVGASLLQGASSLCAVAGMLSLGVVAVGLLSPEGASDIPWGVLAAAVVAFIGQAVLLGAATTVSHMADTHLQRALRGSIADFLQLQPMEEFAEKDSAGVKRMLNDDVGALHNVVAHALIDAVASILTPLLAIISLALLSPKAGLIACLPAVIGAAIQLHHGRRSTEKMGEYFERVSALESASVAAVEGVAVSKVFLAVDEETSSADQFRTAARRYSRFVSDWALSVGRRMAAAEILLSPLPAFALAIGAGVALQVETSEIIFAALLAPMVGAPILPLAYAAQYISAGLAAAQRLDSALGESSGATRSSTDKPRGVWPEDWESIELRGVCCSKHGHRVLEGVDGLIRRGESLALVGPSGGGKTTLAQVLSGLYEIDGGEIIVHAPSGSVSYTQLSTEEIGTYMAFVGQHPGILYASVADNVSMGSAVDSADIAECLSQAQLDKRIDQLPNGLETILGQEASLSGGERQRLTLARALYQHKPLLILDEPTAAVDVISERRIDESLEARHENGTTIIRIDHRLLFATQAEQVWVVERGSIVEKGSPAELLEQRDSHFARLCQGVLS